MAKSSVSKSQKLDKSKNNIINMCFGSYQLLAATKASKGLFYTFNPKSNKYIFIDTRKTYKEYEFDSIESMQSYIRKELKL